MPQAPVPPVAPGDRVEVEIASLATGGEGVARHQGYALFVPFTAPGDRARVQVTAAGPRFGRAVLEDVLEAGPDRTAAPCPYYTHCGGCQLQHLTYPAQLVAKRSFVQEAVRRIARLNLEVAETFPSDPAWNYRLTTEYAAVQTPAGLDFGFMRHHSREVLPVAQCPITHDAVNEVMRAARDLLRGEFSGFADTVSGLTGRHSPATGQSLAILHLMGRGAGARPFAEALLAAVPNLAGVLAGPPRAGRPHAPRLELLAGQGFLEQELAGHRYRVSAGSFFQVNPAVAARLVALVARLAEVEPGETVVDGYAGVGTLALAVAERAGRLVVIEQDRQALADARRNLRQAPAGAISFHPGSVEGRLAALGRGGLRAQVVVLDPPRSGAGEVALRAAAALGPRTIVLVSCDPATLGRDLGLLARLGYPARSVAPLDMFPQTWHVEAIAACRQAAT